MNYFDTSALIKRFVAEKGSAVVEHLIAREERIATAKLAYIEVHAGLSRKRREGHLSARRYDVVSRRFDADWIDYLRVDLRDDVLALSRELVGRHPLRALDAIHLASALTIGASLGEEIVFAAADERLLRSASAEGLRALNVETTQAP